MRHPERTTISSGAYSWAISVRRCSASILVDGQPLEQTISSCTYVTIDRKFSDKDEVTVILPQETQVSTWPMDGIAVEREPLVYSLKIDEEWQSLEQVSEAAREVVGIYYLSTRFPGLLALNAYPRGPWNYALDIDAENASEKVQVKEMEWQDDHPSSTSAPAIVLRIPARRVIGWELEKKTEIAQQGEWYHPASMHTSKGHFVFTPQLPAGSGLPVKLAEKTEMVTLVPYGCARLRLTIFPRAKKHA
jgi:hypothetical protein